MRSKRIKRFGSGRGAGVIWAARAEIRYTEEFRERRQWLLPEGGRRVGMELRE